MGYDGVGHESGVGKTVQWFSDRGDGDLKCLCIPNPNLPWSLSSNTKTVRCINERIYKRVK